MELFVSLLVAIVKKICFIYNFLKILFWYSITTMELNNEFKMAPIGQLNIKSDNSRMNLELFKDVFENSDIADFKARNIEDSDLLEGSEHVNII